MPNQPSAKHVPSAAKPLPSSVDGVAAIESRAVNTGARRSSKAKEGPIDGRARTEERAREAEEDRETLRKAQAGDTAAFRRLIERHQRRAFALALALVRDENDAREVVQDAFLRVHKNLPTFQGGSSFYTWLFRIVTNVGIDLLRKPGRQTTELDEERPYGSDGDGETALIGHLDGQDPLDVIRRQEIAVRLQRALDELPSYHRAVIVLREVEGLSYEEMAQVMGVSKGTIMSRLFHARQKMQRALADCYEEQVGRPAPESQPVSEPGGEA